MIQTPQQPLAGFPVTLTPLFDKCIRRNLCADGTLSIRCKRGLWAVRSADTERAEREARHYWRQYYDDGEYDDLLKIRLKACERCVQMTKHADRACLKCLSNNVRSGPEPAAGSGYAGATGSDGGVK